MNAICHRDLYEEGATIMVEVYDDRVEISNPDGLLPVVAEKFGEKSMSRNPLIFGLFTRMHPVEKVGSGIPRMRRLMKEAGLPEPIFDTKGFFTVTFRKRVKENIGSSNELINGTLNGENDTINGGNEPINGGNDPLNKTNGTLNGTLNNNQTVLSLIQKKPGIRTNLISNQTAISVRTLRLNLKELMDDGVIEYRGSKKTGGYYIQDTKK